MDVTVIGALGLLVVIPVGLGIATMLYERKLNKEELQEKQVEHCCHECCGCQGCVEREVKDEEECGCCGKPLSECNCGCGHCHERD